MKAVVAAGCVPLSVLLALCAWIALCLVELLVEGPFFDERPDGTRIEVEGPWVGTVFAFVALVANAVVVAIFLWCWHGRHKRVVDEATTASSTWRPRERSLSTARAWACFAHALLITSAAIWLVFHAAGKRHTHTVAGSVTVASLICFAGVGFVADLALAPRSSRCASCATASAKIEVEAEEAVETQPAPTVVVAATTAAAPAASEAVAAPQVSVQSSTKVSSETKSAEDAGPKRRSNAGPVVKRSWEARRPSFQMHAAQANMPSPVQRPVKKTKNSDSEWKLQWARQMRSNSIGSELPRYQRWERLFEDETFSGSVPPLDLANLERTKSAVTVNSDLKDARYTSFNSEALVRDRTEEPLASPTKSEDEPCNVDAIVGALRPYGPLTENMDDASSSEESSALSDVNEESTDSSEAEQIPERQAVKPEMPSDAGSLPPGPADDWAPFVDRWEQKTK
eukprot:TRINITY_DN21206_c0_g1_i1.p1 TRINITY_DN21206_c0_g1~~TRINITY_DN21206_c0_g1_i1.p1  ORF type:complete len:455 (+),score=76.77 TRINITY_DN21206_c0_g1_i1:368-1732(+)